MTEPTEFEHGLMSAAREKRDKMVRDGLPCCINCRWAEVRPSFTHKDPDWFAAHYVQCTWPRLCLVPASVDKPREATHDPIMQHMAGTECAVFERRS